MRFPIAMVLLLLAGCGAPAPARDATKPAEPPTPNAAGEEHATPSEITSAPTASQNEAPAPATTRRPVITPRQGVPAQTPVAPTPVAPSPAAATMPQTGAVVPADLLARLVNDAAARAGTDPATVAVLEAEAVTWNDGALGCPQAGATYTQSLVQGYRVLLHAGTQTYDYRAAQNGRFILCARPQLRANPAAQEPSR